MKIMVINGPNLNMLGTREPEIYGNTTLEEINDELVEFSKTIEKDDKIELSFFQSNSESEIIDKIQSLKGNFDGLIINPAAYTHTSLALADAIRAVEIETVEVHISNIQAREDYRKISYVSSVAKGVIQGFGKKGYQLALLGLYKK